MKKKTILGLVVMAGFASLLLLNFGDQVGGYMNFAEAGASGSRAHLVLEMLAVNPLPYDVCKRP